MKPTIVSIDKATKIQYSLFNFFGPIILAGALTSFFENMIFLQVLTLFFGFFIGICSLFMNLQKYNRILCIEGNTIIVCSLKDKKRKIKEKITLKENDEIQFGFGSIDLYRNKNKKALLHTSSSIIALICFIGPFIFMPLAKINNIKFNKLYEIYEILPQLFKDTPHRPSDSENRTANSFMWIFICIVTLIGLFVLLIILILIFTLIISLLMPSA